MDIFLSRNGQQFGPYTVEWLETFVAEGKVSEDDFAWTRGRAEWVPLRVLLAELKRPRLAESASDTAPRPTTEERPRQEEPPARGLDPEAAAAVRARPGLNLG